MSPEKNAEVRELIGGLLRDDPEFLALWLRYLRDYIALLDYLDKLNFRR